MKKKFKFVNKMLHYSSEFNNLIVCHHKLSFHVAMTLFLFKTPTIVCKRVCHTTLKLVRIKWPGVVATKWIMVAI